MDIMKVKTPRSAEIKRLRTLIRLSTLEALDPRATWQKVYMEGDCRMSSLALKSQRSLIAHLKAAAIEQGCQLGYRTFGRAGPKAKAYVVVKHPEWGKFSLWGERR